MNKVSREILQKEYISNGKAMHEIAKEYGVAVGTVFNYCKRYGIKTREAHKGFSGRRHSEESKAKISKAHIGRVFSDETKVKMSDAKYVGGIGHKKKRMDGYIAVYFPDHPSSTKDEYIMEHILVAECLLGRRLDQHEVVHHIDRNRSNNRADNLQVMTDKEHMSLHMKERWAKKKGGDDLSTE